jgi:hypothetical protein
MRSVYPLIAFNWRAQLVAHRREEFALHTVRRLGLLSRAFRRGDRFAQLLVRLLELRRKRGRFVHAMFQLGGLFLELGGLRGELDGLPLQLLVQPKHCFAHPLGFSDVTSDLRRAHDGATGVEDG